jgi:tetratricopeptide (TPR) repeat protein
MQRALLILCLTAGNAAAHGLLHEQLAGLTRSIGRDPGNAALYLKRGEVHRLHRDWQAAQADLADARRLAPGAADVDLAEARLAADRGSLADAEAAAGRYLAARPDSEVALALRADVRERMGSYAAAAADYAGAIRIAAEPRVEYHLGHAQVLARSGDDAAALAAIDAGLARLGPLAVLEHWAIEHLVAARRWDEALARLDRTLGNAPRKETGLTRRAEILALAGRQDGAAVAFDEARVEWGRLPERVRMTRAMTDLQRRIEAGSAQARGAATRE